MFQLCIYRHIKFGATRGPFRQESCRSMFKEPGILLSLVNPFKRNKKNKIKCTL